LYFSFIIVNLGCPITSIREINKRLDLVDTFLQDRYLLAEVIHHLRHTHDSQRLVQRFSLGRGDSDDLLSLSRTIRETEKILARLKEQGHSSLNHIISRIVIPEKLCEKIENAIDEEGLFTRQRLDEMETAELGNIVRRVEGHEPVDKKSKKRNEFKEDAWIMRKTFYPSLQSNFSASPMLKKLHDTLENLLKDKEALQKRLSEELGNILK
jgi:DNA mismatch repair ATPase MutS